MTQNYSFLLSVVILRYFAMVIGRDFGELEAGVDELLDTMHTDATDRKNE